MSEHRRQILMATDLSEDSLRALKWSIQNVSKGRQNSDVYHIVHIAKLKDETPTIHHGPVGSSFHYREVNKEQTEAALEKVKQEIKTRVNPLLDKAGIQHETHLFLEGENATPAEVAATVEKVAEQIKAGLIVASRSNKTWSERWFLGSVAERLSKLPYPVTLVTTSPHAT